MRNQGAMDFLYSAGEEVGPWILERSLGIGGNSEVWFARRGDEVAALKILRRKGDRYSRFRAEVDALEKLGRRSGILPLLASHLPKEPTRSDRAWLAMPVATPLWDAIRIDSSLDTVVRVTAEVAEALGRLHAEGIVHRDIKPSNLYLHEGVAALGDFGLVEYPGKEEITEGSDEIGSYDFIAPEMAERPDEVEDARPADVYSLSKVLFCLATNKARPTLGQIRIDDMHAGLLRWVQHVDARALAKLIERGTSNDPRLRPTMSEFASALRAWGTTAAPRGERFDFTHLRGSIGRGVDAALDARRAHQDRVRLLRSEVRRIVLPLRAFQEALADVGFHTSRFAETETLPPQLQFTTNEGDEAYSCELRCSGPGIFLTLTLSGVLSPDNTLSMVGAHTLRPDSVGPGDAIWYERIAGDFLSVDLSRRTTSLVAHFVENIQVSGEHFVARFREGAPIVDAQEMISRYSFKSVIHNSSPTKGEILVVFERHHPTDGVIPTNFTLRAGSYDPAILAAGDTGVEQEARVQMALAGVR